MKELLYAVLMAIESLVEIPSIEMLPCLLNYELADSFTFILKLKHTDIKTYIDTQITLIHEILSKKAVEAEEEVSALGYSPFCDEFPLLCVRKVAWLDGDAVVVEFVLNTERTAPTLLTELFYNELEEDYEDYDI